MVARRSSAVRFGLGAVALLVLGACSSFGPDTPAPRQSLDPIKDDVASLLIAFDLPRGIGPMPGVSVLTYAVSGARPVKAMLAPGDADEIASRLPPPGAGRAYYFFALTPADQTTIRAAQAGARSAKLAATVAVIPGLCESAIVDPKRITISVLAAQSSGPPLAPLVDHQALADLLGPTGRLPACP